MLSVRLCAGASTCVSLALLLALAVPALSAQDVTWRNRATFYGDNTEFFTPYRVGETILGAQIRTWLDIRPSRHTQVLAGVFGDYRYGSDEFADDVKPIISFRYRTDHLTGVLGTLKNADRHGYLEPLQVTTLELTRPIEYGLQLLMDRRLWDLDLYINWQGLNTSTTREIFDYGLLVQVHPAGWLDLEWQNHGLHHGGQLFQAGVPVSNNFVTAIGARLHEDLGSLLGEGSLAAFYMSSNGNIDPSAPAGRPDEGHGTYLRAELHPWNYLELFGIYWAGRDFLSNEGDNNYNSVGSDPSFYRSRRRYGEIGVSRHTAIDDVVDLTAEFRLHRIDDEESEALFGSKWEYSYRLVVGVPFDVILTTGNRE